MTTTNINPLQPSADATDAAIAAAMAAPTSVGLNTDLDLTKLTLTQNFSQLAGVLASWRSGPLEPLGK